MKQEVFCSNLVRILQLYSSQVQVLISDLVVCRSKYLMKVFDLLNRVSQL